MTPDKFTNQELMLDVGDGHTLYVQDWGNKQAKTPIIYLHGGPGSGCKDKYKASYDPTVHRVIFFDQRGCGKSTPYGSLEHNTSDDLIEDIEKIANNLKLTKFMINGGSWGSCLALAYAVKYPKRITGMFLRGIFTGRKSEVEWIDGGLYRLFYPERWEAYQATVPKTHQNDPTAWHAKNILGNDEKKMRASAHAYSEVEGSMMTLDDRWNQQPLDDTFDPTFVRIEQHYFTNNCFMPEGHIMKNAHKLTMPVWIVQGRYDMVCPPATAYELHQRIKGSRLIWTMSGHGNDRSTYDVLRTLHLSIAA